MKPPATPSSRGELEALPECGGKDAERVYEGDEKVAVTWTDVLGNIWWLAQRPNGSYCKATVDD